LSVRDPVTTEVVRNALATIAEEMGVSVVRGAYSARIKEGADASSAIFDQRGQLIVQSADTFLAHMASLRESIQELVKDFPLEAMRSGDVFLMNDPARGGIHANDIEIFRPVFAGDEVAFFTATLVHVSDLGGATAGGLPAQATDIFQEGLLLPPLRLLRAGVQDDAVLAIIELNSRTPDVVAGDIRALVAGCNIGATRLEALLDRYGLAVLREVVGDLLDYTEDRTRREIEKMAGGRHSGTFVIDDDGIDPDRSYRVRVAVERRGSDLVVDLTGTDPQARGAINASYSQALTGVIFGIRCFLDPSLPMNEGLLRPLQVRLPEGTLVNPDRVAARNARIVTMFAIIEALIDALSGQRPELAVACAGLVHIFTTDGTGADDGKPRVDRYNEYGGLGASAEGDGEDAAGAYVFAGRGMTVQIEAKEAHNDSILVEQLALVSDSGGPGTWRGGLGIRTVVRATVPLVVSVRADRMRYPPPGRAGGAPGLAGTFVVNEGADGEVHLPSKQMGVRLDVGDTLTMTTSGGGGFGPPWRRPAELVRADVLCGRVSVAGARRAYGVVLSGDDLCIDVPATAQQRNAMSETAS
jgi:N-methylhydantoinase B